MIRSFLMLAVAAGLSAPAFAQKAAPLPYPHFGAPVVAGADGRIYVIGGQPDDEHVTTRVDVYDPRTNSWGLAEGLPSARQQFAAIGGADGAIYVAGGYDYKTNYFTSTTLKYDPATNVWSEVGALTVQRNNFALAETGGKIYAVGGEWLQYEWIDKVNFVDVLAGGEWVPVDVRMFARNRLAAGVDFAGGVYAVGGMKADISPFLGSLKVVERFDPATGTWTRKADMLDDRAFHAVVSGRDGKLYAIGGATGLYSPVILSSRVSALKTAEAYDPATDEWTRLPDMPTARLQFGAALGGDGRIYVMGGWDQATGAVVRRVDVYDPATGQWIPGEEP